MPDLAYVALGSLAAGKFTALANATVPVNDRGLQFGDSVYEVIRAVEGRAPFLEEHLKRLTQGCATLDIGASEFLAGIGDIIKQGLQSSGYQQSLVYLQITRGTQLRTLRIEPTTAPNLIATFREYKDPAEQRKKGVSVCLTSDLRWARCDIKSTNLLANVFAQREAAEKGCFEAVMVDPKGFITEGTSSTLLAAIGGALVTPPLSSNLLPGVTRDYVINTIAPRSGIPVQERELTAVDLAGADEVILTSTAWAIMPVLQIDQTRVSGSKPGPIFTTIAREFETLGFITL